VFCGNMQETKWLHGSSGLTGLPRALHSEYTCTFDGHTCAVGRPRICQGVIAVRGIRHLWAHTRKAAAISWHACLLCDNKQCANRPCVVCVLPATEASAGQWL